MCSLMSPSPCLKAKALEIRVLEWRANHTQVQMQNYILQGHINMKFFFPPLMRVYQDRVVELAVDKGWALSIVLSVHESRPCMDVDAVF